MKYFLVLSMIFGINTIRTTAQASYILKSHVIKIYGTSTLHDWSITANKASASGVFVLEGIKIKEIKSMRVAIEGPDLKSDKKSKGMDQKIYEALNIIKCPTITYQFNQITSNSTDQNGNTLNTQGVFNIAGTNKDESLTVHTKINPDATITCTGSKKIKMTDYKIKPPSAMLGAITSGDEVTVTFEMVLQKN